MKKIFRVVCFCALIICIGLPVSGYAQPVASVSISQTSGTNPTCSGVRVTFTAVPINGGASPVYAWYVDGALESGVTGAIFSTTTLATGAPYVYCTMTSDLTGVVGNPATSNIIFMTVYAHPTGAISGATAVCPGDTAILTLHLTGTAPFSGKLSDSTIFSTSADTLDIYKSPAINTTYQIATLSDSTTCTAIISGSAAVTVKARPTASISGDTLICAGAPVYLPIVATGIGPFHGTLSNGATFTGTGSSFHVVVSPSVNTVYKIATFSDANCPALASGLTDSAIIYVIPSPIAMISDSDTICSGQSANITITLANAPPWQVIYTNGIHPDTINAYQSPLLISVSPTTTTSYHISSVTGSGCAAQAGNIRGAGLVVVNPTPTAVISALPQSTECFTNNSFPFRGTQSTVSSGTITNYSWTFNDLAPDTASGPTPIIHFLDSGYDRLVTLLVTTNKGCQGFVFGYINIKPSPNGAFTVSDTAVCVANAVTTQATADTNNIYTWYWGDTHDTACACSSALYSYTTAGDKRLKLSVTNNVGCTDTSGILIHIHPLPSAGFAMNDTLQCFSGNDFVFTDHSTMPANPYGDTISAYNWTFGDPGAASDSASPSHVYTNNIRNTYPVAEQVYSNFGCVGSLQKHVTVFQTPADSILNSAGIDYLCSGTAYTLTALTNAVRPSYRWSDTDSIAIHDSTSLSISGISGAIPQIIYTLAIIDSANNKCTNTATLAILSLPVPAVPIINNGNPQTACDSSTLHFDVTNIQDSVNYFWYTTPALPISGQNGPHSNITFVTTDSATVYISATNVPYGCTASQSTTVILNSGAAPLVTIVEAPDQIDSTLIALVTPDSALAYQWGYDGAGYTSNLIAGANQQALLLDTGQNSADYWVIVTDTATHCSTKVYYAAQATGIRDINEDNIQVSVYPNPATDKFTLSIHTASKQNLYIDIFDIDGRSVMSRAINTGQNADWQISTAAWPADSYVLQVTSASGDKKTLKLIKQ
jgi:hypothetical protein